MGRSKERRRKFLVDHPLCCFCGGAAPSAEPDHVPSRALFDNRIWPEGYEFPACVNCNRASRYDEQVISMLSRIFPDATTEKGKLETQESIRAVANNFPEILLEMRPDAAQEKRAVEEYGLEHRRMPDGQLPIFSVRGPKLNAAIESFARKLFCALYYKHTNTILPPGGGIALRWFTNVQIDADEIPRSLAPLVSNFATLERSRTKLDDQFFYRWVVAEEKSLGVFLAFFRRSFAMLGYLDRNAAALRDVLAEATIVKPYDHALTFS